MRTVELPDEVYERAEQAASARGMTVVQYLERKVQEDTSREEHKPSAKRLDFPLIPSDRPGTLHITKEMIEMVELDDYLGLLRPSD